MARLPSQRVSRTVPGKPRSVPDSRLRWRTALREAGVRCTEQRLAVLSELETASAPLTHRDVLDRLAEYGWDSATIFRNLNDLCDCGLVARIDVGDHVWRFELLGRVASTLQ